METYQIIAGLSGLKVLFRTKTQTPKTMDELELWFTFEDDILWIHDSQDHRKCVMLAIWRLESSSWLIFANKELTA